MRPSFLGSRPTFKAFVVGEVLSALFTLAIVVHIIYNSAILKSVGDCFWLHVWCY